MLLYGECWSQVCHVGWKGGGGDLIDRGPCDECLMVRVGDTSVVAKIKFTIVRASFWLENSWIKIK